jgi:hypothetical protein
VTGVRRWAWSTGHMPVSRLLVRPDSAIAPTMASADLIGLTAPSAAPSADLGSGLGLGGPAGAGAAGPTAIAPGSLRTASPGERGATASRETVLGPLGPVRAARWNAQLPASAAGTGATLGASPNADATSS